MVTALSKATTSYVIKRQPLQEGDRQEEAHLYALTQTAHIRLSRKSTLP